MPKCSQCGKLTGREDGICYECNKNMPTEPIPTENKNSGNEKSDADNYERSRKTSDYAIDFIAKHKKVDESHDYDFSIGNKIKIFAKIDVWAAYIGSLIAGIYWIYKGAQMNSRASWGNSGVGDALIWSGIAILILGPLFAYILYLFIYGFGILVSRTAEIARDIKKQ
jgi:hypothetical protein